MCPHFAYISAVMLNMDLILHPSLSSHSPQGITRALKIAPQKYPATLLCSHTLGYTQGSLPPFAVLYLHLFFPCISLHLCLPVSTFSLSPPPSPMCSFHHPSTRCLTFVSVSPPPAVSTFVAAAVSLLLPPQASSAKLGAAAPLWCSMHF